MGFRVWGLGLRTPVLGFLGGVCTISAAVALAAVGKTEVAREAVPFLFLGGSGVVISVRSAGVIYSPELMVWTRIEKSTALACPEPSFLPGIKKKHQQCP